MWITFIKIILKNVCENQNIPYICGTKANKMTTSILATQQEIQNLKNVNTISHIESKNCTFYIVTFFDGTQKTYLVKH